MMTETEECSNCGNAILLSAHSPGPQVYQFALPEDPEEDSPTFNAHQFRFCVDCQRKIVDWVEGKDESEMRVDTTDLDTFTTSMRGAANDLLDAADSIEEMVASEARRERIEAERELSRELRSQNLDR